MSEPIETIPIDFSYFPNTHSTNKIKNAEYWIYIYKINVFVRYDQNAAQIDDT